MQSVNFRILGVVYKPKPKIRKFTDWISGCCILVKTQAIKEVGLLDNYFFAYKRQLWFRRSNDR